ncbi:MAG: hypothetical protein WA971_08960 [Microbacterium sp.]
MTEAWGRLADEVRIGKLSGAGGPNRRAFRPIMRGLLPEFKANDLYSAVVRFSDTEAVTIRDAIADADPALVQLTRVQERVLAELAVRGYAGGDDRPYTRTIVGYFALRGGRAVVPEDVLDPLVDDVCDELMGTSSNADGPGTLSIEAVNALFRDPMARAELQTLIDRAAVAEHPEPRPVDGGDLRAFLDAVGIAGKSPVIAEEGTAAWRRLAAADATARVDARGRAMGLSATLVSVPQLGGPGMRESDADDAEDWDENARASRTRRAPLDGSLYQRVWSVARSGSGRPWAAGLPTARTLAIREADAVAQPLQLATAEGRAAVATAMEAYLGVSADPRSTEIDTHGMTAEVAEAITRQRRWAEDKQVAAVRILNRGVGSFLRGIGNKNAQTGWARLSLHAQDQLTQLDRVLVPALWHRVHNAQYRPGFFDDGVQTWSLIYGQFISFIRELSEQHKKNPERSETADLFLRDEADVLDPKAEAAARGRLVADEAVDDEAFRRRFHRDERVRETLAELSEGEGEDAVKAFLADLLVLRTPPAGSQRTEEESPRERRARLRDTWSGAAARIARGESLVMVEHPVQEEGSLLETVIVHLPADLAAGWADLIGYLDDYTGS